jgi:hypothetical protein
LEDIDLKHQAFLQQTGLAGTKLSLGHGLAAIVVAIASAH